MDIRSLLAWVCPKPDPRIPVRAKRSAAKDALRQAKDRGDTREQGRLQRQLERAIRDMLEAERAGA